MRNTWEDLLMKRLRAVAFLALAAQAVTVLTCAAQISRTIPPTYGPYSNLKPADFSESKSFDSKERLVGTYYFYWYDAATKSHVLNGDGTDALTDHPASLADFSYKSIRWHKKELNDMTAAGIDVVLPVFWGAPSEQKEKANLHWSYAGLKPLVQAREELLREGKPSPRIGLFYDTSTLRHNEWHEHVDLTTEFGKQWFYATIRDFFSLIPPRHWAMMDGRPIVLLYSASFAKRQDEGIFDFVREKFSKEFAGRVPYIAREISWQAKADGTVAWGGALGLKNPGVASLGPGYDHSAVPGRTPLVVQREGGKFYEDNWLKFLRRPSNFVMVETWNEFHEGTDVCESKEYGRQYIELTRKYTGLFKSGWRPATPKGRYTNAKSVSIILGKKNQESGLRLIENEDGIAEPTMVAGREARAADGSTGRYIYFAVDDSFKTTEPMGATIQVAYFDSAPGTLGSSSMGAMLPRRSTAATPRVLTR